MRTTVDSGGGRTESRATMIRVAGHKLRMDMEMGPGAMMAGSYMLAADDDSTVWSVMPAQRTATILDMSGPMVAGMRPKIDIVDTKMDRIENLGDGGMMLGHSTRHTRMTFSSTTKITLGTDSCTRSSTTTSETWVAPDVDLTGIMFGTMIRRFGGSALTDDMDAALKRAQSNGLAKGAAMRSVSTSTTGGRDSTVKTIMEITELTHGPLDAALFDVPAEYKTMNMRVLMSQLPSGMMESTMRSTMKTVMKAMCDGGK